MRHNKIHIAKIWAWSLGFLLLSTSVAEAQQVWSPLQLDCPTAETCLLNPQTVLQDLAQAHVVYLGETHDSAADHQAQLEIIQALHQRHPRIAIALEMFQKPYQAAIDRYLAGAITEAELRAETEYDQRWGFPWDFYAPILRFAKAQQLPVLALNTPTEVTRKVSRQGLESLTPDEQAWIPPADQIRTDNLAYRRMVREAYDQFHPPGQSVSDNFERFFLTQVLWDETMAEQIAQFLKAQPEHQVIVLAGQGHVVYGHGIPSRVNRRLRTLQGQPLSQRLLLLNPSEDLQAPEASAIADYFWQSAPPAK